MLATIVVIALAGFAALVLEEQALLIRADPMRVSQTAPFAVQAIACTFFTGWDVKTVQFDREHCPELISTDDLSKLERL
jgi:hypothetical protein